MTLTQEITLDIYKPPYFEYINAKQMDNVSHVLVITLTANGETLEPSAESATAVFRALKPDGTAVKDPAAIGEDGKITVALSDQALARPGRVLADVSIIEGEEILSSATFFIEVASAPLGQSMTSENEFLVLLDAVARAEAAAESAEAIGTAAENAATRAGERAAGAAKSAEAAGQALQAAKEQAEAAGKSAQDAAGSETAAGEARDAAGEFATLAKSYARGETGSRDGEDTDNAKAYAAAAAAERQKAEEAAKEAQKMAQGGLGYYETPEVLREQHPTAEAGNWAVIGSTDTIWVWDSDKKAWTDTGAGDNDDKLNTDLSNLSAPIPIAKGGTGNATGTAEYLALHQIANGTDLDTMMTTGTYVKDGNVNVQTLQNCPTTNAMIMCVFNLGGSQIQVVMDYPPDDNRGIYQRTHSNGSGIWSPWRRVYTTGYKPSAADVGAYTKTETDTKITAATSRHWDITVPASSWTDDGATDTLGDVTCTWHATVSVTGMTADVDIDGVAYKGGSLADMHRWHHVILGAGSVTFWARAQLTSDIVVRLMEVK